MVDELCVLCGIRPIIGPVYLFSDHEPPPDEAPAPSLARSTEDLEDFLTPVIDPIAQEILQSQSRLAFSLEDVQSILRTALLALRKIKWETGHHLPRTSMDLGYEHDSLAIGHFHEAGEYTPVAAADGGARRHPAGDGVEVRRVRNMDGGCFEARVLEDEKGGRVIDWSESTFCLYPSDWRHGDLFNAFVHIPCFHYLQAWLLSDMPPRVGLRGELLTLSGELYEVVNSREEPRDSEIGGMLPCIDYGSVIRCYDGDSQHCMADGRKGSLNMARAIQDGKRGKELIPAIFEDYQCWTFMRPDDWPRRTNSSLSDWPTSYPLGGMAQDRITTLPLELYAEILRYMDMRSILALAATSRHTRALLVDPWILTHTLRRASTRPDGMLHWILPVGSLPEELSRAKEPLCTWFYPEPNAAFRDYNFGDGSDCSDDGTYQFEEGDDTTSDISSDEEDEEQSDGELDMSDLEVPVPDVDARPLSPDPRPSLLSSSELISHPAFPIHAFVRACHRSDSMRARQRRWGIIKQFEGLWDAYRRYGWERDEFIPA